MTPGGSAIGQAGRAAARLAGLAARRGAAPVRRTLTAAGQSVSGFVSRLLGRLLPRWHLTGTRYARPPRLRLAWLTRPRRPGITFLAGPGQDARTNTARRAGGTPEWRRDAPGAASHDVPFSRSLGAPGPVPATPWVRPDRGLTFPEAVRTADAAPPTPRAPGRPAGFPPTMTARDTAARDIAAETDDSGTDGAAMPWSLWGEAAEREGEAERPGPRGRAFRLTALPLVMRRRDRDALHHAAADVVPGFPPEGPRGSRGVPPQILPVGAAPPITARRPALLLPTPRWRPGAAAAALTEIKAAAERGAVTWDTSLLGAEPPALYLATPVRRTTGGRDEEPDRRVTPPPTPDGGRGAARHDHAASPAPILPVLPAQRSMPAGMVHRPAPWPAPGREAAEAVPTQEGTAASGAVVTLLPALRALLGARAEAAVRLLAAIPWAEASGNGAAGQPPTAARFAARLAMAVQALQTALGQSWAAPQAELVPTGSVAVGHAGGTAPGEGRRGRWDDRAGYRASPAVTPPFTTGGAGGAGRGGRLVPHAAVEEAVQAGPDGLGLTASARFREDLRRRGGPGHPVPVALRRRLTRALGFDPVGARLHRGPAAAQAARQLRADAFAIGPDVFLGEGQGHPASPRGLALLAHELAHTGQAARGLPGVRFWTPHGGGALEREAQRAARRALEPDEGGIGEAASEAGETSGSQLHQSPAAHRPTAGFALATPLLVTPGPPEPSSTASGASERGPQAHPSRSAKSADPRAVADRVYELMRQEMTEAHRRSRGL